MAGLLLGGAGAADRAAAVTFNSDEREHDFASRTGGPDAFDSIGKVECRDPASPRHWFDATGWLIGDNQTIITAAHNFYRETNPARRPAAKPLDPRTCQFILIDRAQKVRGRFAIRYAVSPWADRHHRYDISYDFAIGRLSQPVTGAIIPAARPARKFAGTATRLYAFRSSRKEARMLHESAGVAERFGNERERLAVARRFGLRITRPDVLLLASANSMEGSSGGMYYSTEWHAAIGIHLGYLCASYKGQGSFDRHSCFNYGRFISRRLLRWVASEKADRPNRPYQNRARSG
jgi:hypothetical protein